VHALRQILDGPNPRLILWHISHYQAPHILLTSGVVPLYVSLFHNPLIPLLAAGSTMILFMWVIGIVNHNPNSCLLPPISSLQYRSTSLSCSQHRCRIGEIWGHWFNDFNATATSAVTLAPIAPKTASGLLRWLCLGSYRSYFVRPSPCAQIHWAVLAVACAVTIGQV